MSDEIMSYEQWLEGVWTDDFWWDYLLDDFVSDCKSDGIEIRQDIRGKYKDHAISFDIDHRQCASSGRIVDNELFYKKYSSQLLAISPILSQMFLEDWYYVSWSASHRGWLSVSVELQNEYLHDESFKGGLMAGTSVGDLYEIAQKDEEGFEQCFEEIIKDIHDELLRTLTEAYEYETSEERYEEWKKEQLAEMNPPPTNAPPSLSC